MTHVTTETGMSHDDMLSSLETEILGNEANDG